MKCLLGRQAPALPSVHRKPHLKLVRVDLGPQLQVIPDHDEALRILWQRCQRVRLHNLCGFFYHEGRERQAVEQRSAPRWPRLRAAKGGSGYLKGGGQRSERRVRLVQGTAYSAIRNRINAEGRPEHSTASTLSLALFWSWPPQAAEREPERRAPVLGGARRRTTLF